jgi:NAD(P)-dependent dehydrogenase (short-subunit alcohol dehydrogenase family)
VLVNNAGTGLGAGPWERYDEWKRVLDVNLWGVINGVHAFLPRMLETGLEGLVINTGSKQGITCPPGNTPYNVSKAGVKVLTESLQHQLRNTPGARISAHLLVPGWTDTAINRKAARDRARLGGDARFEVETTPPRPPGAWTSEQVVDFLLVAIAKGDFYVLCPDNEVSVEMDRKRIAWAAGDLIEGRPPLSRWHPDYADAFKKFAQG